MKTRYRVFFVLKSLLDNDSRILDHLIIQNCKFISQTFVDFLVFYTFAKCLTYKKQLAYDYQRITPPQFLN